MTTFLKFLRATLILLSIPGMLITLYAGLGFSSLLWDEFFPDPADIGHGMAMAHAFLPLLVWTILGMVYLFVLRILWNVTKKPPRPNSDLN